MKDRTAIETIKGYFYQFDFSIIKLLEFTNGADTIVVEGVEDVDINTISEENAIQCKYYEKTEYNHSVIAPAIRLMLKHYKNVQNGKVRAINYTLYGHYRTGQHKLVTPINIEFLKNNFLIYTKNKLAHAHHTELGLTDGDLSDFLSKLTLDVNAIDYSSQFSKIIDLLKKIFNCSHFEAENFYYNNALKVIKDMAVKTNAFDRQISKDEFLRKIDNKSVLFNEWYVAFKGKNKWLSELRRKYFTNLNSSPFERIFLIDASCNQYSRSKLKELIFTISKKWSKLSMREPNPFCPYIYFHNLEVNELIQIKKELASSDFLIIDGFDYYGSEFNPHSICKSANYSNQIKAKIINEWNYIDLILETTNKTKEIYQFFKTEPFYNKEHSNIKNVKIQFEEIEDIKEVI